MSRLIDRLRQTFRQLSGEGAAAPVPREYVVGGLSVQVTRKRVRNLTLRIHPPDGQVRLSAPLRASEAFILRFVEEKLPWIERHRARIASLPPPLPATALTTAQREEMKRLLPPLIGKWEHALGVRVAQWGIKRMKTRWGTCNPRARRIWLNLELMRFPPECLDYVVLHEVAHLVEQGHGERFKAILSLHMPDWKARRARLRGMP